MANSANDETLEAIRQIIFDVLRVEPERVTRDSVLSDLGVVESIKLLRVAGKIERRFDIELDDELFFQGVSVGRLIDEISAQSADHNREEAAS